MHECYGSSLRISVVFPWHDFGISVCWSRLYLNATGGTWTTVGWQCQLDSLIASYPHENGQMKTSVPDSTARVWLHLWSCALSISLAKVQIHGVGFINADKFYFLVSLMPSVWQCISNTRKELVFGEKMMKTNKTSKGMKTLCIGEQEEIRNSWSRAGKIQLKLQWYLVTVMLRFQCTWLTLKDFELNHANACMSGCLAPHREAAMPGWL